MCNGALNIELARFVDSIMGETDPSLLGYLQYLSINKPLVLIVVALVLFGHHESKTEVSK